MLDAALGVDLLTKANYRFLLRELNIDDDELDVDIERAKQESLLVLINCPSTAYWTGEEFEIDFDKRPGAYFWQLARAAKRCGLIEQRDFETLPSHHLLSEWKHRLTNLDAGFPIELADPIEVKDGQHRLLLDPKQVRLFERQGDRDFREVR